MSKPLLSICIPTYNRANYLKECLDSIVAQFSDKEACDSVEVVVSDNASPDNTREVVEEYRKKFGNIRYFRNEENVGFDLNVVNAVEKASGEYCWYMGDDDLIANNSLKFIIDFLKRRDIVVFTVKSVPLMKAELPIGDKIPQSVATRVDSPDEFLQRDYCLGIFSVLGFSRDLWLAALDRNDITIGWLYYEVILKMMPRAKLGFVYFDHPIVFTRQNDADRVKNGTELFYSIHLIKMFKKMMRFGYDRKTTDVAIKNHARSLPLMLCRAKGHDLDCSWDNLSLLCRKFYSHSFYLYLYLFAMIMIFFIPNGVLKIIRDFRKKIYAAK